MKCYFNSNIAYLALFLLICVAKSIIINSNNIKDNILSKPENLKIIKTFDLKKIAANELNILKKIKEKIENSIIRNSFQNRDMILISNENYLLNFFKEYKSFIISISAVSIGFVFAGIFTVVAFILSQYFIF